MYNILKLIICCILLGCSTVFAQTTTFTYSGAVQSYTVPPGIVGLIVDARGACGGNGYIYSRGGYGARVQCTLSVTPGQLLLVNVGQQGTNGTGAGTFAGGYNGGGATGGYAGGGGGATDIRFGAGGLSDRVVVAAGGGGGGYVTATTNMERGGDGGGLTGENGAVNATYVSSGATAGGGGTPSAGGSAGIFTSGTSPGNPGAFGAGGNGFSGGYGGGGGSGFYGGGGGGYGSGGGGGSSYTASGLTSGVNHTRGFTTFGNGSIAITVICSAGTILGTTTVCENSTTTLSDPITGGSWSSSNTAKATVNAATGVVYGVSAGTSTITYSVSLICGSVFTTSVVTVNPIPAPLSGTPSVCEGSTATLSTTPLGGTWTSASSLVAISGTSGIIAGITAGTALVTYTAGAIASCSRVNTVTINPLPNAITGSLSVCAGFTTSLSSTSTGGTWASSNSSVATVNPASGLVTGSAVGTAVLSYTLVTGCSRTVTVSVNPLPSPILGVLSACPGSIATLSHASIGLWSSSSTAIASVGATTGRVVALSAGTSIITFTLPSGCRTASAFIVHPLPGAITGTRAICEGLNTSLSTTSTGGSWSSSILGIATVDAVSGVANGVSAGNASIVYTLPTGCSASATFTVYPLPSIISGSSSLCESATLTLSNTGGGTWSSSNTTVASISPTSGILYGASSGSSTITYTLPVTGCIATHAVTVHPLPIPITGFPGVCISLTTSLSSAPAGGIWSSSVSSVATVASASGAVTGVAPGTSTVIYTLPTGCLASLTVSVVSSPAPITGASSVCATDSISLSNASVGGSWSGSSGVAVGSLTGVVTGVTAGTATVSYSLGGTCRTSTTVTVLPQPAVIVGPAGICQGAATTLTTSATGGVWAGSGTGVATVHPTSGVVIGLAPGIEVISYTHTATGCFRTYSLTVYPLPAGITGVLGVCAGSVTTLSNATVGGTWSSSLTAIATIGTVSGVVSGVAAGTTNITYRLTTTGCIAVATATVYPLPGAIAGPSTVCMGSGIALSAAGGGTWSSATGTVGLTSGIVTGTSVGVDVITYTLPTGCLGFKSLTTNPLPLPISGPLAVCLGSTMSLSTVSTGGMWYSSMPGVASVAATTGIVHGISLGAAYISYMFPTSCLVTTTVSVSLSPVAISGPGSVCTGATVTLTNAVSGGAWYSPDTTVSVSVTSGAVSGLYVGTALITYTLGTGCTVTRPIVIHPAPAPITGPAEVCNLASVTLSNATLGGSWTSGASTLATITATSGVLTGVSAGGVDITYSLPTGCRAIIPFTVNPMPATISGPATVCENGIITLSNTVAGGTWYASGSELRIDSVSGIVMGAAPGVALVTYSLDRGCLVTKSITVLPIAPITGPGAVCLGLSTTLSDATAGGTWSSSHPWVATAGLTSGAVGGVSTGTTTITYTMPTGCYSVATLEVNALPAAIGGVLAVCPLATTTLTNATGGGTWVSGSTGIATIEALSGIVTGVAAGVADITYSLGTGCTVTGTVLVNPLPAPIMGPDIACVGLVSLYTSASSGGAWSTASPALVLAGTLVGSVTGAATDTAVITYTLPTGCMVSKQVTVNPIPAPITGSPIMCIGAATSLFATGSGTWTSSNHLIAAVDTNTGVVTGITNGTARITFTQFGCPVSTIATVYPLPNPIAGALGICHGTTNTLLSATGGGTWASGNTAVATIVGIASGVSVVRGLSLGTATITYSHAGCYVTATATVNPQPAPITGTKEVCAGLITTLSNSEVGSWRTDDVSVALVGYSTGAMLGVSAGTTLLSFILPTGCSISDTIRVRPIPPTIGGTPNICLGAIITLSNTAVGGTWSSSHPAIASVLVSGMGYVQGITPGSATISYVVAGCPATLTVRVHDLPPPIGGITNLCAWGGSFTATNSLPGGGWSSAVVTVSSVGVVTAHAAGLAAVTYTMPTGCQTTSTLMVHPLPSPILGPAGICAGALTTFSCASAGGSWSLSHSGSVATVAPTTGIVGGIASGAVMVTYTLPTGCFTTTTLTVYPRPSGITGAAGLCPGSTTTLSDSVVGGVWSSSSTAIASIGSLSGVVVARLSGVSTISYSIGPGCMATRSLTVLPLPLPFSVTGGGAYCAGGVGLRIGLSGSDTAANYQLYLGASSVGAPVLGSGLFLDFGLVSAAGIYTVVATQNSTGCTNAMLGSATISVNPIVVPAVNITAVPGLTLCAGTTAVFTAIPVNGGSAPAFSWTVNGVPSGTAATHSYLPANGDVVSVKLTSNATCAQPDTSISEVVITVLVPASLSVAVTASPSSTVAVGEEITFNAAVTGGVPTRYQWYINGILQSSATGATLGPLVPAHLDSVSCTVSSGGLCRQNFSGWTKVQVVPVAINDPIAAVSLIIAPNPATGIFSVIGKWKAHPAGKVQLKISGVSGNIVYTEELRNSNGAINQQIDVSKVLSAGVYLVSVTDGTYTKVFKLVIR